MEEIENPCHCHQALDQESLNNFERSPVMHLTAGDLGMPSKVSSAQFSSIEL